MLIHILLCFILLRFDGAYDETPINRQVASKDIRATLVKTVTTGTRDRRTFMAVFNITTPAGKPFTIISNARMTMPDIHLSSRSIYGRGTPGEPRLCLSVSGVKDTDIAKIRRIGLDLQAGSIQPTCTWNSIPLTRGQAPLEDLAVYQGPFVNARIASIILKNDTNPETHRIGPTLAVSIAERAKTKTTQSGFLRFDATGFVQSAEHAWSADGETFYELRKTMMPDALLLPAAITIRYYSAPDVNRSLKPRHLAFTSLRITVPK